MVENALKLYLNTTRAMEVLLAVIAVCQLGAAYLIAKYHRRLQAVQAKGLGWRPEFRGGRYTLRLDRRIQLVRSAMKLANAQTTLEAENATREVALLVQQISQEESAVQHGAPGSDAENASEHR